ncbi:tetratricopeptide repeat protein [Reichenbachiella ulvae]|uniref:Tetratricopeptide repeat protein n=1 Tax=Reichenbachiella ulvae TaxID=2980104 RepID=A0ABT3CNV9_9BACT|nr:tetratricopeptide repeat protein [Reichenbachiella ulvae]MCV9385140.1 tetratricopeptide repeat protein [Reichenbachiella ulvae]
MKKSLLYVLILVGMVSACSPANRKNRIKYRFETANKKLEDGYYADAVALYSQVLEKDPEITDAYMNRGVAYYEMGKYVAALADYNEVYRQRPEYHDLLFNRAYTYLELGRMENAREDLTFLRTLYPDTALIDVVEGLIFEEEKEYEAALQSFSQAIARDADHFDAYSNRGIIQYHLGAYDQAEADLRQALEIHQNEPYVLNSLALVLAEKGELNSADSLINLAMGMVGGQPYFINNAGYISLLQGKLDESDSLIRKSLKIDEDNPYAYENLGKWYLAVDSTDQAKASFAKALELDSAMEESLELYQGLVE